MRIDSLDWIVTPGRRVRSVDSLHSPASRQRRHPLGAALALQLLDTDPYGSLAQMRAAEPVSWVPVLDGWLVTRRDLCIDVMRDAELFTVDDPRFSTAQVVGPSMLSLDGAEHQALEAVDGGLFVGAGVLLALVGKIDFPEQLLLDRGRLSEPVELQPQVLTGLER